MNLDWAIAIAIFIVLFAWSVFYYADVLRPSITPIPDVSESIISQLLIKEWTVPVKFSSTNETNDTVLYASIDWPSVASNSTRVWNGNEYLPCNITDGKLYWQTNLTSGDNYFWATFHNQSESLNCSASLNLSVTNQTIPWAVEASQSVSTAKLSQFLSSNYTETRRAITDRNFKLSVDWLNGTVSSFGPNTPKIGNVISKQVPSVTDTGQKIKLTILMW